MLELIISLIIHCVISFILVYCYDTEKIWHNNETSPHLRMPKLDNLNTNCHISVQQNYVEKVIIPAHDYFSDIASINAYQKNEGLTQLMAWLPTFLLVSNEFRKAGLSPCVWLDVVIGVVAYILITVIVFAIYSRTKLKLGTFELSISDIKNDFYYIRNHGGFEFDLSDENALNNFIIEKHYNYISFVHYTIEKRYRIKKVVEVISGLIYFLFIWRIPN